MNKSACILFIVLSFSFLSFSQDKDERKFFVNTTALEIFVNNESGYSNESSHINKGFGFELSTFNGFFLFKKLSLSIGAGISINVNEYFNSLPMVGDLKWYLYDYGINSPYILLNAGKNLNIGSFKGGYSSKLGIGYSFESDFKFQYIIEVFIKSKEFLINKETNFNYQTTSLGVSLGIKL